MPMNANVERGTACEQAGAGGPAILGLGTALPPLYVEQRDAHRFYDSQGCLPERQRALYARLLLDGPVRGRYFGMNEPREVLDTDPDVAVARFTAFGRRLAADAARAALRDAGVSARDIGGVVVNTCTGYLCPGLTSYLAEDLGLSDDVKPADLMGMGCGGAIPGLECGCGLLDRARGRPVLCVAVEVCSATHFMDDDPGLTVSNCIFGDGAAAVVLGHAGEQGIALLDFESGLFPEHRSALRYDYDGGRLRNRLTRRVPVIGASCIERVALRLLKRHGLVPADISWWAVHAGGTAVLDEVGKRFGLNGDTLSASRQVFLECGNMSSPTVLFALRRIIELNGARGRGLILAFGAGFSAFAALAAGADTP
jgi:alkylresorcinol/alkylpyrone synthase